MIATVSILGSPRQLVVVVVVEAVVPEVLLVPVVVGRSRIERTIEKSAELQGVQQGSGIDRSIGLKL